jgi:hypothetical protein
LNESVDVSVTGPVPVGTFSKIENETVVLVATCGGRQVTSCELEEYVHALGRACNAKADWRSVVDAVAGTTGPSVYVS